MREPTHADTTRRTRSARDTVRRYLDVLYNERRLDLIPDLIADPTWRHKAGEVKSLTIDETIERLQVTLDLCPVLHFDTVVLHGDDDGDRQLERFQHSERWTLLRVLRHRGLAPWWTARSWRSGTVAKPAGHWQPSQTR